MKLQVVSSVSAGSPCCIEVRMQRNHSDLNLDKPWIINNVCIVVKYFYNWKEFWVVIKWYLPTLSCYFRSFFRSGSSIHAKSHCSTNLCQRISHCTTCPFYKYISFTWEAPYSWKNSIRKKIRNAKIQIQFSSKYSVFLPVASAFYKWNIERKMVNGPVCDCLGFCTDWMLIALDQSECES